MYFKFPASIYLMGVFLAGLFLMQYPHELVTLAEPTIGSSHLEIKQLQQHDVVYLGENHNSIANHQQQLEIITQLDRELAHNRELAIGLEMFQRPFQPVLNRYLAQKISEAQLREQSEYDARWGFDWELYAPILRYALTNQIPLTALNTPSEITLKVAEQGLNSLENSDFRYIPPLKGIKLDNQQYRQKSAEIYQQHAQNGLGNSKDSDNFFAAQVLWDETMAEAIALYYQNHPQAQMVVLVGKAHVMDDYAIPNRVARRISDPTFSQATILLDEAGEQLVSTN
ncbi:ChaN family lipoprotein [Pleurocapsales cyanobacterium LEGE 10410]|nr:ChaN family lipoprotein [Pleurocapsales cyanobacterium LEGE 10410]